MFNTTVTVPVLGATVFTTTVVQIISFDAGYELNHFSISWYK